jgi:hypothetical protein
MAGSFQDAFIAAGLMTQEDIDRKEKEKKDADRRQKELEIAHQQIKEMEEQDARNRRKEKRPPENPFDRILRQSRNLMAHLIHAFTPFDKGQFAFFSTELKNRNCCICNCKLISKEDLVEKIPQLSEISLDYMKDMVNGTLTADKFKTDCLKITGGAVVGVVSKTSNSAFCPTCHREFAEWLSAAVLKGNPHVHRIISKMNASQGQAPRLL